MRGIMETLRSGRREWRIIILFIIILSLSSCQNRGLTSPENVLNKLGITKDVYRDLSLCQRLDTVVNIGYNYIDEGHLTLVIPDWLTEGLSSPIDRDRLLICADKAYGKIAEEKLANDRNESTKDKTTTLLYLMIELRLQKEEITKNIFYSSICKDMVIDDIVLLRFYYYLMNSSFPEDDIRPDSLIPMICSNK